LILFLGVALAAQGQQAGSASGTASAGATTPAGRTTVQQSGTVQERMNTLRENNSGNNPNGRAFNATNPPNGRPFRAAFSTNSTGFTTNNTRFAPAESNAFPANPQFTATNGSTMQANDTNTFANGNEPNNSQTINASITNTLSTMSPVQANNVIQVEAGLNSLQQTAISLGGVQNVQQIIQQNPQVQEQLQKVQSQISALSQGQVRPTSDIVARLSEDLLRVNAQTQLSPNQLLVLAIVINQAVNSADMSPTQIENAINTGLANLESAGAPRAVSHLVGCDLHSIAFQLQPNLTIQ